MVMTNIKLKIEFVLASPLGIFRRRKQKEILIQTLTDFPPKAGNAKGDGSVQLTYFY
jgi:hypothetical protein